MIYKFFLWISYICIHSIVWWKIFIQRIYSLNKESKIFIQKMYSFKTIPNFSFKKNIHPNEKWIIAQGYFDWPDTISSANELLSLKPQLANYHLIAQAFFVIITLTLLWQPLPQWPLRLHLWYCVHCLVWYLTTIVIFGLMPIRSKQLVLGCSSYITICFCFI